MTRPRRHGRIARLREWLRVLDGEVDVVIGARSAVFAPFARLGLVVFTETRRPGGNKASVEINISHKTLFSKQFGPVLRRLNIEMGRFAVIRRRRRKQDVVAGLTQIGQGLLAVWLRQVF